MYIKIILISLFALLVQHGFKIYSNLDLHKHIFNHYPGPCRQVDGIDFGSEDMHMLPNGTTFITSGFWMKGTGPAFDAYYTDNKVRGRIFIFDLQTPTKEAKELTLASTDEFNIDTFHPHGISAWEDPKTGRLYLFVVNHETDGTEKIEKFLVSLSKMSLQHIKSYTGDPLITVMNDVVATGEDSFYFTNFFHSKSTFGRVVENFGMLPWSNVVYFNGHEYRVMADGLMMGNGIQISKDGKYIYVAAAQGKELRIYERRRDNSLHLREILPLYSGPDNIMTDPVTGDLYIGAHPIGYKTLSFLTNPAAARSPSQVLQIKLKDGMVSAVQELFVDDGNLIAASSVATVFNKRLLIGSVIDKLVYCDVSVPL